MPIYYASNASVYATAISNGTGNYCNNIYLTVTGTTTSATVSGTYYWAASSGSTAAHYNRAAALDRSQREFDAKHKAATLRSYLLLRRQLTAEQWRTFRKNKWFVVTGGKSGKRYRIHANGSLVANVDVLADNDNARVDYKLCAHPEVATVPTGDHLLSQKIMLEWAEEEFIAKANRHAA